MRLLLASFGLVSAELASFTVEKNEGATFLSKRVRREENFPENLYKLGCSLIFMKSLKFLSLKICVLKSCRFAQKYRKFYKNSFFWHPKSSQKTMSASVMKKFVPEKKWLKSSKRVLGKGRLMIRSLKIVVKVWFVSNRCLFLYSYISSTGSIYSKLLWYFPRCKNQIRAIAVIQGVPIFQFSRQTSIWHSLKMAFFSILFFSSKP